MKKVIFISYQSLTEKFYNDFYIKQCLENGIEIEYWDVKELFYPYLNIENSLDLDIVSKINTYSKLKYLLLKNNNDETLFIPHINYRFNVIRLFYLLTKYRCKMAFFARGALPVVEKNNSVKVFEVFLKLDLNRILRYLGNLIAVNLKKIGLVKTYDLLFMAGSEGYNIIGCGNNMDRENAKIVDINYYDYDLFLSYKENTHQRSNKYCVFLDEYFPHHPDLAIVGEKSISHDLYYSTINKFFDSIELVHNLKVVIAAHPKSHLYTKYNYFDGREVFFNKTCELVKNAEFVLTSSSTSISFAILYKKPIIFITSRDIEDKMFLLSQYIKFVSSILNCKLVYFDTDFDKIENVTPEPVDDHKFRDYKYKYLTSKTSECNDSTQIFIDFLKSKKWD